MNETTNTRSRSVLILLFLLTAVLGLTIRSTARHSPTIIGLYAPDTLWALLVFWVVVCFAPRLSTSQAALLSLAFAFCMESSQLYQAPWINDLRATRIGGLVLGFGFLWSDLACYSLGVGLGVVLDRLLFRSGCKTVTERPLPQDATS